MRHLRLFIAAFFLTSLVFADATNFPATGGNVDFNDVFDVGANSFSLAAWVNTVEDNSSDRVAGKKPTSSTSNGYCIEQNSSDLLFGEIWGPDNDFTCNVSGDSDGTWYFIVLTYSSFSVVGLSMSRYNPSNGISLASCTDASLGNTPIGDLQTTNDFRSGTSSNAGDGANGSVAHVQVFTDKILSEAEMMEAMYKPGMIGAESGNWGYMPHMGDTTEVSVGGQTVSGTATTIVKDQGGPPVMFGGGVPL